MLGLLVVQRFCRGVCPCAPSASNSVSRHTLWTCTQGDKYKGSVALAKKWRKEKIQMCVKNEIGI